MHPDRWFWGPNQTRFVPVGQCSNGDAVAIDTTETPGAIYYIAGELSESKRTEAAIREAASKRKARRPDRRP